MVQLLLKFNLLKQRFLASAPRFQLILTAKLHSLYVKESGVRVRNFENSESEILESRESESDISPLTPQS